MGQWYHAESGISDAFKAAGEQNGELLVGLTTPAGLGKLFTQLFEGDIAQGPDVGGAATWEFDGRLRAETFANLVEKYGGIELTDNDRALFDKVAATSHIVVDVGQDDALPRKLELTLESPEGSPLRLGGTGVVRRRLLRHRRALGFRQDVSFSPPKDARPLDELFGQLFGVMG